MLQLILHLIGDYVTQSDWMANNKTKNSFAAAAHAIVYSLPFLFISPSWAAFSVILITHFLIDRFRLARFVVWAKNRVFDPSWGAHTGLLEYDAAVGDETAIDELARIKKLRWSNCSATGYPSETPPWLAVWLLIAADNTLHLLINWASLTYL